MIILIFQKFGKRNTLEKRKEKKKCNANWLALKFWCSFRVTLSLIHKTHDGNNNNKDDFYPFTFPSLSTHSCLKLNWIEKSKSESGIRNVVLCRLIQSQTRSARHCTIHCVDIIDGLYYFSFSIVAQDRALGTGDECKHTHRFIFYDTMQSQFYISNLSGSMGAHCTCTAIVKWTLFPTIFPIYLQIGVKFYFILGFFQIFGNLYTLGWMCL